MVENRIFDTHVQGLKYKAVKEIIIAYDQNRLSTAYLDIPKKALPGPKATLRCCIYKERAIFSERLRVVQSGVDQDTKSVVEVIDIACDECPAEGILVTQACRGCLSHKCAEVCPVGAISIVNKHSVVDSEKCIECGKCVNACPYNAIIKQQRPCVTSCKVKAISYRPNDKKAVVDENKCISCGACVRQCPFGAIQDKSMILETLDILKNSNNSQNYKVYAIVAPSIAGQFNYGSVEQIVTGLRELGFAEVAEAAFGADVCLSHELHEWQEKRILTTSCCPSFVQFIEKNFPMLTEHISSSFSPMVETAKTIKAHEPNAKCIFIGPCASKKMECKREDTKGYIDTVLSFEELQAFFDAREIEIDKLQPKQLESASYLGRIFAKSGGITEGITKLAQQNNVADLKPIAMSGLDECRLNLLKLKIGKSLDNFFEGMACDGGCIKGPLCLSHDANSTKKLNEHSKNAKTSTIEDSVRQYNNGKMDIQ